MLLARRDELEKNYESAVFDALTQFQFLESLLRDCICLSYAIIRASVKDILDFGYDREDLERDALKTLCAKYKKLTLNKDLVGRIKKLADKRNEIAHSACFEFHKDMLSGIPDRKLHNKGVKIQQVANEASSLVTDMLKEYYSLIEKRKKLSCERKEN
jgi:hypothetical protein